jgi:co-chaperonin GroES (HSP10)
MIARVGHVATLKSTKNSAASSKVWRLQSLTYLTLQREQRNQMTTMAEEAVDQKATQLPKPQGWKVLCAVPEVEDRFSGTDLLKPESISKIEEHSTTVLFVVGVGLDAYKDTAKFPSGAWCKEGDFVLVRAYSGTRFKIHGREFRLLNDDQIEAVVEDPRGYTRA